MAGQVVPFPAVRRVGHISKLAHLLASYSPEGAQRALAARLNTQYAAMLRRGISPEAAECELRALERAIRARLWAVVMRGGDSA